MPANIYIRVFEHQTLRLNDVVDGVRFKSHHLEALQFYYGETGCHYYQLTHKGVKFTAYVGVLQVAGLTIEVLPKTDRHDTDKTIWHQFLIDMLRAVGFLDVYETGYSSLRVKSNSILDLYMALFIKEVRYLLQTGLVKKYRKSEGNSFALKGSLVFSRNIQHNLVHAERFYVRHSTYDSDHQFNQILYKALLLIRQINTSADLSGPIESLLLDFPECGDVRVIDALFEKLVYDRKTEVYRKAIAMAKLLLLNYHPDIRKGRNDVLALMFDMNKLWEAFVYRQLKRAIKDKYVVKAQAGRDFWQPAGGRVVRIYPDMVVYNKENKVITILDTKWKNISGNRPSDDDLKQMFAYNLNFNCAHSALIYPSCEQEGVTGSYANRKFGGCSLIFLVLEKTQGNIRLDLKSLQDYIKEITEI